MARIDPRAVISPKAQLADDVEVGAFAVIGDNVVIGPRCWIGPHAVINGPTSLGADNQVFQFASLGDAPQDKKYKGEPTRLEIGDRNIFREYCTVNRGTVTGNGVTRVGDDNMLLAYTHVAHEGGFDLARYPHITGWLARVKAQPGYVAIDHKF
jgi:UDP-N-acetylglucosamine acyltransferase